MKGIAFIAVAILTILMGTMAKANNVSQSCANVKKLAHAIMTVRQTGAKKSELISVIQKTNRVDAGMQELIDMAYRSPIRSTKDEKAQSATEFSSGMYQVCMYAAP